MLLEDSPLRRYHCVDTYRAVCTGTGSWALTGRHCQRCRWRRRAGRVHGARVGQPEWRVLPLPACAAGRLPDGHLLAGGDAARHVRARARAHAARAARALRARGPPARAGAPGLPRQGVAGAVAHVERPRVERARARAVDMPGWKVQKRMDMNAERPGPGPAWPNGGKLIAKRLQTDSKK